MDRVTAPRCGGGEWWPARGRRGFCATFGVDLCGDGVVQCSMAWGGGGAVPVCDEVRLVVYQELCFGSPQASPFRLHWSGYSLISCYVCVVTGQSRLFDRLYIVTTVSTYILYFNLAKNT